MPLFTKVDFNKIQIFCLITLIGLLILSIPEALWAVRVKDVAYLRGARDNQLIGFGIVVGLDGTGDSQESLLSRKPVISALERIGISLESSDIAGRSIAAVWLYRWIRPLSVSSSNSSRVLEKGISGSATASSETVPWVTFGVST